MKYQKSILFCIVLLAGVISLWIYIADFTPRRDPMLDKIDSLSAVLSKEQVKRDTLRIVIDSSTHVIHTIEKWHEKEANVIRTQPMDSDMHFFSKYLSSEGE